jgi:hypothetical protein
VGLYFDRVIIAQGYLTPPMVWCDPALLINSVSGEDLRLLFPSRSSSPGKRLEDDLHVKRSRVVHAQVHLIAGALEAADRIFWVDGWTYWGWIRCGWIHCVVLRGQGEEEARERQEKNPAKDAVSLVKLKRPDWENSVT